MPSTQTDKHPSGAIICFQEEEHLYTDNSGNAYKSFTTLIHDYFPKFDAVNVAAKIADKRKTTAEQLMREWSKAGEEASRYGTRTHENCECLMKGLPVPNSPLDDRERNTFVNAATVCGYLRSKYDLIAAEKILFSPRCLVAGTIDILMADGNKLLILDWKTNREIKSKGYDYGLYPVSHLVNCNYNHYALQLSLAEVIAKMEGYIPRDTVCQKALLHLPPMAAPQWIDMPDMRSECYEMLIDHVSTIVPF